MRKTATMQLLELRYNKPIRNLLHDMYVVRGKSLSEIAREFDVSLATISKWMDRFGIPKRQWVLPPAASGD